MSGYSREELAEMVRSAIAKRKAGERLTEGEEIVLAYELHGFGCHTCAGAYGEKTAGEMKEAPVYTARGRSVDLVERFRCFQNTLLSGPFGGSGTVICTQGGTDLIEGERYTVLRDDGAALSGMLRVVDESGEDHLHEMRRFGFEG